MSESVEYASPSEAARRLGVSVKALRLYETRGLVTPLRLSNGWRAYHPDAINQVARICALRDLGLSLTQVGRVLKGEPADLASALNAQEASLKAQIDALPVAMEKDYAVVYDSTMARFWFFSDAARQKIPLVLQGVPEGRIMPEEELKRFRAHFADGRFGELIFLVQEGVLIVPSHMGERPIRAMHGYHPHDPQSYAALFSSSSSIPADITHIPHIHRLMEKALERPDVKCAEPSIHALAA